MCIRDRSGCGADRRNQAEWRGEANRNHQRSDFRNRSAAAAHYGSDDPAARGCDSHGHACGSSAHAAGRPGRGDSGGDWDFGESGGLKTAFSVQRSAFRKTACSLLLAAGGQWVASNRQRAFTGILQRFLGGIFALCVKCRIIERQAGGMEWRRHCWHSSAA